MDQVIPSDPFYFYASICIVLTPIIAAPIAWVLAKFGFGDF